MILRVPDYYKEFQCIANRCKDNCCIGWEIDIDEDTYEYYRQIDGELGKRFKQYLKGGEVNHLELIHKRCPFLNTKNLCDICMELGEAALCEVCTEYPRFTVEYGAIREKMLALSCEEAGRLLFEHTKPLTFIETDMGHAWGGESYDGYMNEEEEADDIEQESDAEGMDIKTAYIRQARDMVITLLQDRSHRIDTRIILCLQFAKQVQDAINHNQVEQIPQIMESFHTSTSESTIKALSNQKAHHLFQKRMDLLEKMEILDEEWLRVIKALRASYYETVYAKEYEEQKSKLNAYLTAREYEYEHLLVYFTFRYVIRSVYDDNFLDKFKFAVVSYLTIRDMDLLRFTQNQGTYSKEDRIDIARIFSKEVEHSEDNLEYLAEAMLFESVCDTESLCRQCILPKFTAVQTGKTAV